jgi:hydroxyacylglutathione hydrolase
MPYEIVTLSAGYDNYCYGVISGQDAVIIDATDAEPVTSLLNERRLTLRAVLSTHHHGDHTGGNRELKKNTGCTILGGDRRIAGIDRCTKDGEVVFAGPFSLTCISVPGHTRGCSAWYFEQVRSLFTGDTLFYAGCGRLFEGSAKDMHASLTKVKTMPADTVIYCGHEYTLDNLSFARSVEPGNGAISDRMRSVRMKIDRGEPSGPSTVAEELGTNPFLRTGSAEIRSGLHLTDATDAEVFAELRRRKDRF